MINPKEAKAEAQFIDCVMYVRAQLSLVLDGVDADALLLTEQCAEMLIDAVKKYELQEAGA